MRLEPELFRLLDSKYDELGFDAMLGLPDLGAILFVVAETGMRGGGIASCLAA